MVNDVAIMPTHAGRGGVPYLDCNRGDVKREVDAVQ